MISGNFIDRLYQCNEGRHEREIIDLVRIIRVIGLCGEEDLAQKRS